MTPEPQTLEVRGLRVRRSGREILRDVTLPPLATGEIVAFVGPNGAGKSTLLRAIAQVLPADGSMRFAGRDLSALNRCERARLLGYMPQEAPGDTELTVLDGVMVALGAGSAASLPRAVAVLARLGLADLALRPLDRLSGGQRQLASLAQTIAHEPRLLLLDEPISALDLARQYEVMRHLRRLAEDGAAVAVVLHDLALAARWADRIVVLREGAVHAAGPPEAVVTPSMLADVYGLFARVRRAGSSFHIEAEGLVRERQGLGSGHQE